MTESFPRILFCTWEIPQSVYAGSMQLYRVMQGYPGDRLMVLGNAPAPGAQLLPCRYEPLNLLTHRLACTRFGGWATGLNSLDLFPEPGLGASVELTRDFKPDLVVTVMDKLSYYKHAWALSRRLGAGLVTITMDDPQVFEPAVPSLEPAYTRFLGRMYGDAVLSLGVSQEMCEYLSRKFGRQSSVFYFGPPDGIPTRAAGKSLALRQPPKLTLGYAGSLSLGYRDGLCALLDSLAPANCTINVYSNERNNLIDHPQIVNRGFLPPEMLWPAVQAECDAVLLPYSFGKDAARIYRTHFPTKLSEYCWVGMPMLVVGPEYATGVRWGLQHPQAAVTVRSPEPHAVGPVLQRLRDDGALRVSLARGAADAARQEFDPAEIRKAFVSQLRQAASGMSANKV